MKKLIKNISIIILIMMSFTFTNCELADILESDDGCSETEKPLIERTFILHIYLKDATGDTYTTPTDVDFSINKEYCDETTKGFFYETVTTGMYGYAISKNVYTYKLANVHDKVVIHTKVEHGLDTYRTTKTYYYNDVANERNGVGVDLVIVL